MNLHVVIYSEVLLYSGGRETWLGYFLPLLAARERFDAIHVYHMRPSDPARALPAHMPPPRGTPITFHAAPVPIHGGAGGPLRRFARFTTTVLGGLHRASERGDLLLAVGVQGEAPPALLGWLLSRLTRRRLRLVVWFREANLLLVKKRRGRAVHAALRALQHAVVAASTWVVTNGEHTLEIYRACYPRKRARIRLVPNAVELERFAGVPLPDPEARPLRVAFVGRFMAEKGFLDFLEAARRTDDRRLVFGAWGNTADGGADARPPANLTLHPPVPHTEIPALLAAQHAVVFLNRTPWSSGLSHALLEALAAGRLVIAWDIPCHRQVVTPENGVLLPEGDVAGLAAAFLDLAAGRFDLATKGQAARAAAARYSCAAHVDRFLREVVDADPKE